MNETLTMAAVSVNCLLLLMIAILIIVTESERAWHQFQGPLFSDSADNNDCGGVDINTVILRYWDI